MNKSSVCSRLNAWLVLAFTLSVFGCDTARPREDGLIQRGKYLVEAGGCDDCHSPKVFTPEGPIPDLARRLSGHPADERIPDLPEGLLTPDGWGAVTTNGLTAWYGPWGVSFASNLTSDESGLGHWTESHFIQTMRTGKHIGVGRPVLPPMPWFNIGKLTDDDLKAMLAYLRSLPPVRNRPPDPIFAGVAGQPRSNP